MVAGAGAAPSQAAGAFRVRLPDPVETCRDAARGTSRAGRRRRGLARLGRGVPSRRRLDRTRSDLRPAHRRRSHPARRDGAFPFRSADHRDCRARSRNIRLRDERSARRGADAMTPPFSDEAWAALDALGEQVDADLTANDVRLTMGGEPTFVSIDDHESPEWTVAALGE